MPAGGGWSLSPTGLDPKDSCGQVDLLCRKGKRDNESKLTKSDVHRPVLLKEVLDFLKVEPGKKYIDATVGGGGHAVEIVKRGGILLGIDCDTEALKYASERLRVEAEESRVERGNFKEIDAIAKRNGFGKVAGILFDLGMSSWQIEHSGRGFTFQKDEPLDMRMDTSLKVTAAKLLNSLNEDELAQIFQKFGEERLARVLAAAVVRSRRIKPIQTTADLVSLIEQSLGRKHRIHPATKAFQALRIAVNDELENLKTALPKAVKLLQSGGRIVAISFHSLEDRIIKREFARLASKGEVRWLTKKPLRPSEEELSLNPRARSAKLRTLEKT